MSTLLRATAISGRPVVTLAGESPFEVKDVVFARGTGSLIGFTLRKHGFLGGPVSDFLPWDAVHGLGPDAVVVASEDDLTDGRDDADTGDGGGDIIGSRLLTESGTDLGEIVEAVVSSGSEVKVVGLEVEASEAINDDGAHVFIPLPDTIAISGERTVVPDSAREYVRDDLSGFGAAVEQFRAQLSGGS